MPNTEDDLNADRLPYSGSDIEIFVFLDNLLFYGVGQEVRKTHDGMLPVGALLLWPGISTISLALQAEYSRFINGYGFNGGKMLTNNF